MGEFILDPQIQAELDAIVDDYYPMPALNLLLKRCIASKAEETTNWSNLTILTHHMLGGDNPAIQRLAALTEMVVLALDIMDDLQDQDNPDKPWMSEPQDLVLNAMLALFMAASAELTALKERNPLQAFPNAGELSRLISIAINGQHTDLTLAVDTEEEYVKMVHQKSCMLIHIAFYLGLAAIPSERMNKEKWEQMKTLADYIGLIAQINNDISDLIRFDIKNDVITKKRTLPILFLLSEPDSDFPQLQQYFDGTITVEELLLLKLECLDYITNSGCLEYSKMIVELQRTRVIQLFAQIPAISPWKERLQEITLGAFDNEK
jgi:competence protein ComQ